MASLLTPPSVPGLRRAFPTRAATTAGPAPAPEPRGSAPRDARTPHRAHLRWFVATLVGGLASGMLAKIADDSAWTWAAELGTYLAVWVLAVALLAVTAPTPATAAWRSAVAMAAMCVGYYGWAMGVLDFSWTNLALAWMAIAVTAVPIAAALVRWARDRAGVLPVAITLAMVVMTASDGIFRQLWLVMAGAIPNMSGLHLPQVAADLAVIITLCLLPRAASTRRWSLALAPLAVLAAPNLIDVLISFS